jgi:hypothetical protein
MHHLASLARLGATDCEALAGGWLAQPVLALTSLAYVVAGAAIATSDRRRSPLAVGAILVMVGIGSVAFHGPGPGWAGPAHDVPIALLAVVVVLDGVRAVRGGEGRAYATGLRPALGVMAVALVAYAFGRTGGPLCDPDGPFQLHGLWHVLSAIAVGMWARACVLER